jgi:hypothetical protein
MSERLIVQDDPARPWWRRRWLVQWDNGRRTRGWTIRGTRRMAERAQRWNPELHCPTIEERFGL